MRKRYFILGISGILIIAIIVIFLVWNHRKNNGYISASEVYVLHYDIQRYVGPDPYRKKIIDQKKDIRKIIHMINQIEKEKIDMGRVYGCGSERIAFEDKEGNYIGGVYSLENKLCINSTWYEVREEDIIKIRQYYDSLDYEEVQWDPMSY